MLLTDRIPAVRFAIEAHIRASQVRSDGGPGRSLIQKYLNFAPATLSDKFKTAAGLSEIAFAVEDLGIAPPGSVTALVERVELRPRTSYTVNASWWPLVRDMFDLSGETSRLQSRLDILLAAEAFAAFHQRFLDRRAHVSSITMDSSASKSCEELLSQLCWLASGPFGVTQQANRLISQIAPLAPDVVTDFIRSGVVTTQVIHALDRTLRRAAWNDRMQKSYSDLLANPPEKIYRRTYWMRALRRLQLASTANGDPRANWITRQLLFALKGERSYTGARATDRRYAFWCLAELLPEDREWNLARSDASADGEVADLIKFAQDFRSLRAAMGSKFDAFKYEPKVAWGEPYIGSDLSALLDPKAVSARSWPLRDDWSWANEKLTRDAASMLADAIFNPDVIRQRAALDAWRAGPPELMESISRTVVAILSVSDHSTPDFVLERCLAYLGMLGRESAVAQVESMVRASTSSVAVQAIATAGDLAYRHPKETVGLMAWASDRANRDGENEDLVIAAVHALTAHKAKEPKHSLQVAQDSSWAVRTTFEWSERVFADPKFRE